jgi:cadmium resistance protein CadD (predicted permease)
MNQPDSNDPFARTMRWIYAIVLLGLGIYLLFK